MAVTAKKEGSQDEAHTFQMHLLSSEVPNILAHTITTSNSITVFCESLSFNICINLLHSITILNRNYKLSITIPTF